MPTATYIPLATITLSSTDSEIVFSSIPNNYKDLILVSTTRNSSFGNPYYQLRYRVNGDSGSNYNWVYMIGDGSNTGSSASSNQSDITVFFDEPNTSSAYAVTIAQFMDYSATDKHKSILIRSNAPSVLVGAYAARWASTSAITSISLTPPPGFGSWASGSTFSLYGIAG